ncbi:MAG: tetratricopeptide repeat protein [Chloroflexota bacterium]
MMRLISRKFDDFSLFLGPARLRTLFVVIAATGLVSLMLNAVQGDWVLPAQSLLLVAALAGAAVIIIGKMDAEDRGRWLALLLPSFGAVVLALTLLPQFTLPLVGGALGWVVAGMFFFRSRGPMEYQAAVKHLRKSEYAEAVKTMDILIKQQPLDPNHYRFRAELLRLWGKLDKAKKDYVRMTELEPESAVAYNGLAEVLLQAGDYDAAREAGLKAAELAPDEWVALYNLGMIEDRLGRSEDVIAHIQAALAQKVPDARHRLLMYLYLARASARLGDTAAAQDAVIEVRKHKTGLEEWQKILESDQAEMLRAALGDDVNAAAELAAGRSDVMALAGVDEDES